MHHEGDLLRGPRMPSHPGKALLRRSFFAIHRTDPPDQPVNRGLVVLCACGWQALLLRALDHPPSSS
jgi:hypothetical protein